MRPKTFLFLLALMLAAASSQSATLSDSFAIYGGVNGVAFTNADPWNGDVEAAGNASASLSPHISAVGSVDYGFSHAYFRTSVGARVTATDVNNPDFSVGLGIQYRSASVVELRPNEWAPDVSVGLRPWPAKYPNLLLVAQGWYGLDTNRSGASAGARWRFKF